ncbi:hypothetical protein DFLDMN_006425 (plasmid) [Cupriavidus sp. H19C3]|jgi:hypothetical protein
MLSTARPKKPAANIPKAHSVTRTHLKHGAASGWARSANHSVATGLTKVASTLSGGASLGLATAVLVPGTPIVAGIAAVAGLIGSGLLVKRYG